MTRKRQSNRPDRRVLPAESVGAEELQALAVRLRYGGSSLHKLYPGDYGFVPPINPRPSKSLCDELRPLLRADAVMLFRKGLAAGMVSRFESGGVPKYVWAVDAEGEVYEAKAKPPDTSYHGYRIGEDEPEMRRYILREWRARWPQG
ncbi:MAG TPA: hypothetical protein VJ770_03355 [Stellaceae bacterium]|nr:hypothetical protein [Stellaceae bacterium]